MIVADTLGIEQANAEKTGSIHESKKPSTITL
jgi:hypothetical protein